VKLASIVSALKEKITPKKVEDTIRHVKQSYSLEDIRLFKYDKLKAMAAVVLATACFSMVWIGNSEKHAVIARSIARMSFRIHGVAGEPREQAHWLWRGWHLRATFWNRR